MKLNRNVLCQSPECHNMIVMCAAKQQGIARFSRCRAGETAARAPGSRNGLTVTAVRYNISSSTRRLPEHHMVPAEVCDGQEQARETKRRRTRGRPNHSILRKITFWCE